MRPLAGRHLDAALYDRIAKAEKVRAVNLADPEVIVSCHCNFAVLAPDTLRRPKLAVLTG